MKLARSGEVRAGLEAAFQSHLTLTWRKGWRQMFKRPPQPRPPAQATPRQCHCPFSSLGLSFPICKRAQLSSNSEIPGESRQKTATDPSTHPPGPGRPQSGRAEAPGAAPGTLNTRAPPGEPGGPKAAPARRTEGSACGARSGAAGRRGLLTGPRGRVLGRGSGWG